MKFRSGRDDVPPERMQSGTADAAASNAGTPPALVGSLRQLMILRTIALCGQAAAVITSSALGIALPLAAMSAVVASLVALNAVTWVRLKRPIPASHAEIAGHLAFDLAAFTLLLYFSGGTANPFSLIFVLHAVLMALLLPPLLAGLGTLLVVASFSIVVRFHLPLRLGSGEAPAPALLSFGDWLSFALTAVVTAWFVVRIVAELREHDRLLREAAQKALNDETILRLGTLAAGAAHELATPMTTMAVVAGEMGREAGTPSLRRDADILAAQIEACRRTISNLLAAADHARAEGGGRERLDAFLHAIANRFRTMRPEVLFTASCDGEPPAPQIFAEQALTQSILALLNNAADASPGDVRMTARWDEETLRVTIGDRGSGLPQGHLEKLGRMFFTTKPPGKGTGLGMVLAANAVKHLGGTLRWENRAGGGTQAEMALPLRALRLPEED
jgi:two-component system, sensor histidine kinase RegB